MYLKNLLNDALQLDIFDLNFSFSSEIYRYVSPWNTNRPRKGILVRMSIFLIKFLKSILQLKWKFWKKIPPDRIIFFASSKNQKDALLPIVKKTHNSFFLGLNNYGFKEFPITLSYFISLFFLPIVFLHFIRSKNYHLRQSFYIAFDWYWFVFGFYIVARIMFHKLNKSVLVNGNDHSVENRIITKAAQDEGIITFHIQHATVITEIPQFPVLNFDYALLDGFDALNKYDVLGKSNTKVFLIGMSKFDSFSTSINTKKKVEHLGVCLNTLDQFERVEELCQYLIQKLPGLSVRIRPHPADTRKYYWFNLAKKFNFKFSDPTLELSFDFLKQVDVVIVGESNIILEAILINVFPIRYDFIGNSLDICGFIKGGLIDRIISDPNEVIFVLINLLEKKPNTRHRAKYYCASLETKYEGKSTELASSLIKQITESNNGIDMSIWKKIPNLKNLTAYELKTI